MRALTIYVLAFFLVLTQAMTWATVKDTSIVDPAWEDFAFTIEDSRCFVGIAPIYLSVSELKPEGGKLIGYYELKVPVMSSNDDRGKIVLSLNVAVDEIGKKGGVLIGKAHSEMEEGVVNDIVCEIIPKKDQAIRLAITTKDRTLKFKSRYSILDKSEPKSES